MFLDINYEQNKEKRFVDDSNHAIAGNGDSHNLNPVIRIWGQLLSLITTGPR